jgi:hypothetical protein
MYLFQINQVISKKKIITQRNKINVIQIKNSNDHTLTLGFFFLDLSHLPELSLLFILPKFSSIILSVEATARQQINIV